MGEDADVDADNVLGRDQFKPGAALILRLESTNPLEKKGSIGTTNLLYSLTHFLHFC